MSKLIFISRAIDNGEVSAAFDSGKLSIYLGSIGRTLTKSESERFAVILNAEILEPMKAQAQKRKAAFEEYQQRNPGAFYSTFEAGWNYAEENNGK